VVFQERTVFRELGPDALLVPSGEAADERRHPYLSLRVPPECRISVNKIQSTSNGPSSWSWWVARAGIMAAPRRDPRSESEIYLEKHNIRALFKVSSRPSCVQTGGSLDTRQGSSC